MVEVGFVVVVEGSTFPDRQATKRILGKAISGSDLWFQAELQYLFGHSSIDFIVLQCF